MTKDSQRSIGESKLVVFQGFGYQSASIQPLQLGMCIAIGVVVVNISNASNV